MGQKLGKQLVNGNCNVRECVDCHRLFELNSDNFPIHRYSTRVSKTKTSRYHSRCRECYNSYERQRYLKKKESDCLSNKLEYGRNNRYQRKYGLTAEQVDSMYAKGCMVCGEKDNGKHNLHIDHCHKTGKVRGCLCVRCNQGLGNFRDDPKLLTKAIQYLLDNG